MMKIAMREWSPSIANQMAVSSSYFLFGSDGGIVTMVRL